jgi:hypothetical protein
VSTHEDLDAAAELEQLRAENAKLRAALDRRDPEKAHQRRVAEVQAQSRAREAAIDSWKRHGWWARLDAMTEPARTDYLAGFGRDWTPRPRPTEAELAELRTWIREYVKRLDMRREWACGKFVLFVERHVGLTLRREAEWDDGGCPVGRAALAFAGVFLDGTPGKEQMEVRGP